MNPEFEKPMAEMGLVTQSSINESLVRLLNGKLTAGCRGGSRWTVVGFTDDMVRQLSGHPPFELGPRRRTITIELMEG